MQLRLINQPSSTRSYALLTNESDLALDTNHRRCMRTITPVLAWSGQVRWRKRPHGGRSQLTYADTKARLPVS